MPRHVRQDDANFPFMRTSFLLATGLILSGAALAIACGSSAPDSGFGSSGSSGTSGTSGASGTSGTNGSSSFGGTSGASGGVDAAPPDECKKMDIVFVVDNSGSMAQEQTNLKDNFPAFIKVINEYKTKSGQSLEYRVATTTSDDGKDKGAFTKGAGRGATAGCNPGPNRAWLERADGDVAGFFGCRAPGGTSGSSYERMLESGLLSVADRVKDGTNGDFVREDALLAMVYITDEDEGGTENQPKRPVSAYPALYDAVKGGERGKWAAAVIAGETNCSSPGLGNAAEAKRMKEFVTSVGKNGVFASICVGNLTEGLTKALQTFDQACKDFPAGPVK